MKNANLKKILVTVLAFALVLSAIFVLSSCKKEEHVHTLEESVLTKPTCTTSGVNKLVCSDPECDYTETKTVEALGHDYVAHEAKEASCETEGYKAYKTCSRCDYTTFSANSIIAKTEHKYEFVGCEKPLTCACGRTTGDKIPHDYKDATCTEPKTCKECRKTEGSPIPHDYKPATCVDPATCKYCPATFGVALGHVESEEKTGNITLTPTCTREGSREIYIECTRCWEKIKKWSISIPMLDHDLEHHEAQEPTCVIGWYAFDTCKNCSYTTYVEREPVRNHYPSEHPVDVVIIPATCTTTGTYYTAINCSECGKELSASEEKVSLALGHKYIDYPAKAATCTEIGWDAYHTCSNCGDTNYSVIPATGHSWTGASCTEPSICSKCFEYSENPLGHDIEYSQTNVVDPTCVASGSYVEVGTCKTCGQIVSTETMTIQPLGHLLYDHLPKSPTCTEVGWKTFQSCTRCTYSTYQDNIIPANGHTGLPAVSENPVGATCTTNGHYDSVVYCSVCSAEVSREEKIIPANGHTTYTYEDNRQYSTCTTGGSYQTVTKCSVCRAEISRVTTYLSALGHSWINVPAEPNTCRDNGYTAHEKCTRCYITIGYEIIPWTGHLGVTVHEGVAPTCTTPGVNDWEDCSICGYSNYDEMRLPALGHDMVIVPQQDADCLNNGHVQYTDCSRCDHTEGYRVIPATGHVNTYTSVENIIYPTCTEYGSKDIVDRCTVCDAEVSKTTIPLEPKQHNYDEVTGKCTNINENDNSACPGYYTPCLSFALKEDGTMAVTGTHVNTNYTEIIIPERIRDRAVTSINDRAFYNNQTIVTVVIPDSVTSIGASAFYNCKSLSNITIGKGVTSIGRDAFKNCTALSTVNYRGTEAQWNAIYIATTGNDSLKGANRKYI